MHSLTHALVTLPAMLAALRYHWNQLRRSAGNPQPNRQSIPSESDPAPMPPPKVYKNQTLDRVVYRFLT